MNIADSNGLNHTQIFKLNAHTDLTLTLNVLFQTLHSASHKLAKIALTPVTCSSLSTLSRCWHINIVFSKPARQKLMVFRVSKSLNDNFQMNIGRVTLFPLIYYINLSLRAQGLHILIENTHFPVLTALIFLSQCLLLTEIFQF